MAKVYGQIVIDMELEELSASGTRLDLMGLSAAVKQYLEALPMTGPQMRVLTVESPTKDWEIEAQLSLDLPFSTEES